MGGVKPFGVQEGGFGVGSPIPAIDTRTRLEPDQSARAQGNNQAPATKEIALSEPLLPCLGRLEAVTRAAYRSSYWEGLSALWRAGLE